MLADYLGLDSRYFANTKSMMFMLVIMLFGFIGIAYSGGIFEPAWHGDIARDEYLAIFRQDSIFYSKIVILIVNVFMALSFYSKSHSNLAKYCVTTRKERLAFQLAKIIYMNNISLLISLLLAVYLAVYMQVTTYMELDWRWLFGFWTSMMLFGIFYSALTSILEFLIRIFLIGLLPIVLFSVLESNPPNMGVTPNGYMGILHSLVPYVYQTEIYPSMSIGLITCLAVQLAIWIIIIVVYLYKDID